MRNLEAVNSLLAYCRENNRVSPMPQKWSELFEMLPDKRRKGLGSEPSLPLILAAWYDTPALLKMLRLQEHIEWADTHDSLERISQFLRLLPEGDWFHIGD